MPAGYSFRPRVWTLALAAAGCAAFIALGNWQAGRATEKRAAAHAEQRAQLQGRFLAAHAVFLDNKIRGHKAGYEVVMPLQPTGEQAHVLVNRGWVPAMPSRDALPAVRTPAGEVRIEGVWKDRFPRPLQLQAPAPGRVRPTLDIPAYAKETGLPLAPRYLEQHSALDDGLLREWPRADAGVEKHESYSLQWYSLALLAAALGIVFSFRRVAAN
jgi:surfeit locus 1 family protein